MESSRSDSVTEPHHNMHDYDTNSPPNSRLFVVCSKSFSEDDIREIFAPYGDIQDIYIIRDKTPARASKGVCFIKYYKSSEACKAMEELNGKHVKESERPIKVLMAQIRSNERSWSYPSGGSQTHGSLGNRMNNFSSEEEQIDNLLRLFVTVDKKQTQDQIKDYFSKFGIVDHVHILKDKESGESRGVAYVKFYRASHAALALEEASPEYKAILADPRPPKGGPVAHPPNSYPYNVPFNSNNSFTVPPVYGSKNSHDSSVGHQPLHHTDFSGYPATMFHGYSSASMNGTAAQQPPITPLFPPPPPPAAHPMGGASAANAGLTAMLQMAACGDDGAGTHWMNAGPHPGSNPAAAAGPVSPLHSQPLPSYDHINMACRTLGFNSCRIQAFVDPRATETQLRGIFDLIPGLESFNLGGDLRKSSPNGFAYATYSTPFAAMYAKEKLNGLEFPVGSRITTKLLDDGYNGNGTNGINAGNRYSASAPNMFGSAQAQILNLQMSRAMALGLGATNVSSGAINNAVASLTNPASVIKSNTSPKVFQSSSAPMPNMGTGDSPQQDGEIMNGPRNYIYTPGVHANTVCVSTESYPSFTSSAGSVTNANSTATLAASKTSSVLNQTGISTSAPSNEHSGRKTKKGPSNGASSGQNKRNNSTGALKSNGSSSGTTQRSFGSSGVTANSTGNVAMTNGTVGSSLSGQVAVSVAAGTATANGSF